MQSQSYCSSLTVVICFLKPILCLDEEQRNIIDKLANFVARNGPKFEELTKSKQRENEKFAFLFGGEYHSYYNWKVSLESML